MLGIGRKGLKLVDQGLVSHCVKLVFKLRGEQVRRKAVLLFLQLSLIECAEIRGKCLFI